MSTFVALTDGFQIFRYPGCGENDDENSSKRRDGSFSLLRCCLVMESPQNSVRYKPASQSTLSASSYIQRFFQATLSRLRSLGAMRLSPSCEQKVTCRKLEPHISSLLSPSIAGFDFSSQSTVEKVDVFFFCSCFVSKSCVSSCPSPTLVLSVPLTITAISSHID